MAEQIQLSTTAKVFLAAGCFVVAVIAYGLVFGDPTAPTTPKLSVQNQADARQMYMNGCTKQPSFYNYCSCTWDKFVAVHGSETANYITTAWQYKNMYGDWPVEFNNEITTIAAQCINLIN